MWVENLKCARISFSACVLQSFTFCLFVLVHILFQVVFAFDFVFFLLLFGFVEETEKKLSIFIGGSIEPLCFENQIRNYQEVGVFFLVVYPLVCIVFRFDEFLFDLFTSSVLSFNGYAHNSRAQFLFVVFFSLISTGGKKSNVNFFDRSNAVQILVFSLILNSGP